MKKYTRSESVEPLTSDESERLMAELRRARDEAASELSRDSNESLDSDTE